MSLLLLADVIAGRDPRRILPRGRPSVKAAWTALIGLLAVALGVPSGPARAQDMALPGGRPLSRLTDAFPVTPGDVAIYAGVGSALPRHGPKRVFVPIQVEYAPFARTQLSLSTTLLSHPREVDDPHAYDLTGSVRVDLAPETTFWPAVATALVVTTPTGAGPRATVYALEGYASKALAPAVYGHLNAAVDVADRIGLEERRAHYRLALGLNAALPWFIPIVIAADVFSDQSTILGERNTTGVEIGMRWRLTPNLTWDIGLGSELWGPRGRATFFLTTGFGLGFALGRR